MSKIFFGLLYTLAPVLTDIFIKVANPGAKLYIRGTHAVISELLIVIILLYRVYKKTNKRKTDFLLIITFFSVCISDYIYMSTFFYPNQSSLLIMYLAETGYTIFTWSLATYLLFKYSKYLRDRFSISIAICSGLLYLIPTFYYILLPFYSQTVPIFYKFTSTTYTIGEVFFVAISIPVILRIGNLFEIIFLKLLVLLTVGDFAIRYNSVTSSTINVTIYPYVWEICMALFFLLLLFDKLSERNFKILPNYQTIRGSLSLTLTLSIISLFVVVILLQAHHTGDAYHITNIILTIFLIWTLSTIVSYTFSKKLLIINDSIIDYTKGFDNVSQNRVAHILNFSFEKISVHTKVFEIDNLITQYNLLSERTNTIIQDLKQQSALAGIGQSTAMLAHDIRKPFSHMKILLNSFEILKSNPSRVKQAKLEIEKAILRIEKMISDILDFSRDTKVTTAATSLNMVLKSALEQIGLSESNFSNIKFSYDLKHKNLVSIDESRFSRVIINIVANALEAIQIIGGKDTGNIWFHSYQKAEYIALIIGNDGPPIPDKSLNNIFESIFTQGKKKGTGLGLASCKKIMKLHEGSIEARNLENRKGVEFILEIKLENKLDENQVKLPNYLNSSRFETEKSNKLTALIENIAVKKLNFKILLLDDEALYRAWIKDLVNNDEILKLHVSFYDATNVKEAIEISKNIKLTHAIVDIDLGSGENGYQFLESIDPQSKIKTIIHSNQDIEKYKQKTMDLRARAFISKPLPLIKLVEFIIE